MTGPITPTDAIEPAERTSKSERQCSRSDTLVSGLLSILELGQKAHGALGG